MLLAKNLLLHEQDNDIRVSNFRCARNLRFVEIKKKSSTLNGQFEKYKCPVIRSIRHEIETLLERYVYTVT